MAGVNPTDDGHKGFRHARPGNPVEGGAGCNPSVPSSPKSYALSGKIMLSAIVVLFTVVLLILCLHVYARWYLLRRARLRRRTRRRLVFTADHRNGAAAARGLDPDVVKSLPVFTYSAATRGAGPEEEESMECAVCLSEFQEDEKGRTLPLCKHSFHIQCIDMWFYSHATCPLCRCVVEPDPPLPAPSESVRIQIHPPAPPDLCDSCRRDDEGSPAAASSSIPTSSCSSSNSSGNRGLSRLEVLPRRGDEGWRGLEEEAGSPGVAQGFKSPASRMRSLKRILSIDLRFYRGGSSSSNEPDLERGGAADTAAAAEPTPRPTQQQQQQR
uniref:RING-type E3 ubiquitin transferase n=1 Tax=Anthurium amnicola TaxID=1678845 RepID=A0A1D1Z1N2_9ARAE